MKNKVTEEQVEFWLGRDSEWSEITRGFIIFLLRDLANGDYKQNLLRRDIINTCLSCGFEKEVA